MATVVRRRTGRRAETIGQALGLAGAVGLNLSRERREEEKDKAQQELLQNFRRDVVNSKDREAAEALAVDPRYAGLFEDFEDDKAFGKVLDRIHPSGKESLTGIEFTKPATERDAAKTVNIGLTPKQRVDIQTGKTNLEKLTGQTKFADFALTQSEDAATTEKPSIILMKDGQPLPGLHTTRNAEKAMLLDPSIKTLDTVNRLSILQQRQQEIRQAKDGSGESGELGKAAEIESARGLLDTVGVDSKDSSNVRKALRFNRVEGDNLKAFGGAFGIADISDFNTFAGTNKGERVEVAGSAYTDIRDEVLKGGISISPSKARDIAIKVARNLVPETRGEDEKEGKRNPGIKVSDDEARAGLVNGKAIQVGDIIVLTDGTQLFYIGIKGGVRQYLPL